MSPDESGESTRLDALLAEARARLVSVTEFPAQEARWLAEHVFDCTSAGLIIAGPKPVAPSGRARYREIVARRAAGEPLAYLLGQVPFWSFDLRVTPDTLIPRADTETLVQAALDRLDDQAKLQVADLGTGSGAIALALARERPLWQIIATDASASALAVARGNAQRLGLCSVRFRHGDWFAPLTGQRLDAIIANPPYIAAGDAHLAALGNEPYGALVAADEGLSDLAVLIAGAPAHLMAGGWLMLEHGAEQSRAVAALLAASGFMDIEVLNDPGGRPRVVTARVSTAAVEPVAD